MSIFTSATVSARVLQFLSIAKMWDYKNWLQKIVCKNYNKLDMHSWPHQSVISTDFEFLVSLYQRRGVELL